jgi:hypothetical protein
MRIRATHLEASVLETASGFNRRLRHQAFIATEARDSTDHECRVNAKSSRADATLSQRRDWMEEISKRRMQRRHRSFQENSCGVSRGVYGWAMA